jgi:hypothetical protein
MDEHDSATSIDDIRYADPSKYHLHDVLILKHFLSNTDLTNKSEFLERRNHALDHKELGVALSQVPWPHPPPRPREELEAGVEECRAAALRVIDARLSFYKTNSRVSQASFDTTSTEASAIRGYPHRVLGINELLEKILRNLAPSAQYASWNVSVT